jgi:hypothetical protein
MEDMLCRKRQCEITVGSLEGSPVGGALHEESGAEGLAGDLKMDNSGKIIDNKASRSLSSSFPPLPPSCLPQLPSPSQVSLPAHSHGMFSIPTAIPHRSPSLPTSSRVKSSTRRSRRSTGTSRQSARSWKLPKSSDALLRIKM